MRLKNRLLGLILAIVITGQLFAQTGVIISTEANQVPHESAMLEIKSNGKGLLIPRLTALERMNIQNPADGLMVYQTSDVKGFYYYLDNEWHHLYSTKEIIDYGSGQIITATERIKLANDNDADITTTVNVPTSDDTNGEPKTSSETRVKNASVNYIIKY